MHLKIPTGRKSLKITERSKNYGLKIPVRVRIYARVYALVYDCGQIAIMTRNQDQDQDQDTEHHRNTGHDRNTTTGKGRNTGNKGKPEYICMIAGDEKKYKKS